MKHLEWALSFDGQKQLTVAFMTLLRHALPDQWVERMREMVLDSFVRPTYWDKLYSTGLATFFCAQKTVLLPMTSQCGQNMARFSPLASMAEQLLNSTVIRAAEPSEGMVAVGEPPGAAALAGPRAGAHAGAAEARNARAGCAQIFARHGRGDNADHCVHAVVV